MSRIRNCTVHSRSRQISTAQKRYKGTQREGRAETLIVVSATKIPLLRCITYSKVQIVILIFIDLTVGKGSQWTPRKCS